MIVVLYSLKKDIEELLKKGVEDNVFPGAAAGIYIGENTEKVIAHYGYREIIPHKKKVTTNTYFDLASLTKPLATTLAIWCLLKEKKISLQHRLADFFKNINDEKNKITVDKPLLIL